MERGKRWMDEKRESRMMEKIKREKMDGKNKEKGGWMDEWR